MPHGHSNAVIQTRVFFAFRAGLYIIFSGKTDYFAYKLSVIYSVEFYPGRAESAKIALRAFPRGYVKIIRI
jgi:hypothetical protein